MQTKVFEIVFGPVGSESYWTVLAVRLDAKDTTTDEEETINFTGKQGHVLLTRIDPSIKPAYTNTHFTSDHWGDAAAKAMHQYIIDHFLQLPSGSTIDYRHVITGEHKMNRPSQRVVHERLKAAKKPLFR